MGNWILIIWYKILSKSKRLLYRQRKMKKGGLSFSEQTVS
ncbi:hypothetical protein HMPREF9391_0666 [Streptococcus sanguinis SK408]|uniref:Uncharacterized protein n=1 Tax=Streptococcus sanguinis SK408 TaxID=888818 RepID=F2CCV6_STRSA|nr:hypothetical protein HMPREF9391_0666 [Streptococcus sanguinis SK408]